MHGQQNIKKKNRLACFYAMGQGVVCLNVYQHWRWFSNHYKVWRSVNW